MGKVSAANGESRRTCGDARNRRRRRKERPLVRVGGEEG